MNPSRQADCANPALEMTKAWRLPLPAEAQAERRLLDRWVCGFRLWRELDRSRQQLAMLDDRQLKDIGLSRGQVLHEIDKPFWRP